MPGVSKETSVFLCNTEGSLKKAEMLKRVERIFMSGHISSDCWDFYFFFFFCSFKTNHAV